MEDQVSSLLGALKKPSTNVDARISGFTQLKSSIKHGRVPESCQAPILECVRIAITTATSAALVSTGFSTLSHFIKRLQLQKETQVITSQASSLCLILAERLGDAREAHRNAASQILADLHCFASNEVDARIHDAMGGNNARAKEASMQWLVKMNKDENLPFKSYSNQLVVNLEDADAGVRDVAKGAVVELFGSAPEHAKVNLKKQLASLNVRKTIVNYIVSHLDEGVASKEQETHPLPPPPPPPRVERPLPARKVEMSQPDVSSVESLAIEQPSQPEAVSMDPQHIHTQRELDDMFRDMAPHFEGRESEQNWLARDENTTKLRRILKGNAPVEFQSAFLVGIKSMLDGILKVANSLRTTMSTNGCQLVQELAKTLEHAVDPWAEILLQSFVKMCAATKNIAAQNGNITVDAIISNVSYNHRILQHVSFASQDKNVQPRIHSASWVKTLIRKHKSSIEHSGGLDTLEKIIKKGVTDANPKVREAYRSTYWIFALVWSQRAEAMFETLDKREKAALEKDPNNPNSSLNLSQSSTASFSRSVNTDTARNTLKEKIAEQRRAKLAAAKGVPERPNSAAATYSPMTSQPTKSSKSRNASNTSNGTTVQARPPSAMSSEATKSALKNPASTGSLMGGSVRRPIRPRPEIARPATADPYAVRKAGKSTPSITPEKPPTVTSAKKSVAPKSNGRPRSYTQNSPSVSPVRSKSRLGQSTTQLKPPTTSSHHGTPIATPAEKQDLTVVRPWIRSQSHHDPGSTPFLHRSGVEKNEIIDNDAIDVGDDDNFTMVIPSLARPMTQPAQCTPPKMAPAASRLPTISPRAPMLQSPKSMSNLETGSLLSFARSPRIESPDRPNTRGTDAQKEVRVYEDPFIADEPTVEQDTEKPVLEELHINEKSNERRCSAESMPGSTAMGNGLEEHSRGHLKTTSTGSVMRFESNDTYHAEILRNRQLLVSGIKKIENRTVEAHMFRRMQDMVKSNQGIWGSNDENFGRLLLACLDFLESLAEELKVPPAKAVNLKVQALATIRAMLSLYHKETARYYSRMLCAILRTKSQYENTSHMAMDLESTTDEIIQCGQTSECLDAVLSLVEGMSYSDSASSPGLESLNAPSAYRDSARTITMALGSLASLVQTSGAKSIALSTDQTARLGKLAVRCMDDQDAEVRRADIEFCVVLHERIARDHDGKEDGGFWRAVAGASEQHLNLLTYYLAKRSTM